MCPQSEPQQNLFILRCIAKDNNNINTIVGDGCGHSFLFFKKTTKIVII